MTFHNYTGIVARQINYYKYLQSQVPRNGLGKKSRPLFDYFSSILIRVIGLVNKLLFFWIRPQEIDVLVLPQCVQDKNRLKPVVNILKKSGLNVANISQIGSRKRLLRLQYAWVPIHIPKELVYPYSIAKYYLNIYKPKVVVFIENAGLLPILFNMLLENNVKTINLAHSITGADWNHSLFDFDYYFMFGQSSVNNANKNDHRYGTTRIIKTGSYSIDRTLSDLAISQTRSSIVYFSQWMHPNYASEINKTHKILIEYSKRNRNKKLYVKLHPLEDGKFWEQNVNAKEIPNIEIINGMVDINDVLSNAFISIVAWSNAALESAIANRPVIAIDRIGLADKYLDLSKYFPIAKDINGLENAVKEVENNYDEYIQRCRSYTKLHMERTEDSREYIADMLQRIYLNENIDGPILTENYKW